MNQIRGTTARAVLFQRNAFDKDYFEFLSTQSGSTGLVVAQLGDSRTYGVTVNKSF